MFIVIVCMLLESCDVQGGERVLCLIGSVFRRGFGYVLLWCQCFLSRLNIGLCTSLKASFNCSFCLLRLYT
jgi:hypothetical protein